MNQQQIIEIMHEFTTITPKECNRLMKSLKRVFENKITLQQPIKLPFLGKIEVYSREARNYYDINDEDVKLYGRHDVIRMVRYGAQQQLMSSQYHNYKVYRKSSQRNNTELANELAEEAAADLLICMDFVETLIEVILYLLENGEKATIYRLGTFKPIPIKVPRLDPMMSNEQNYGISYNESNGLFIRNTSYSGGIAIRESSDLQNWSGVDFPAGEGAIASDYSPELGIICCIGGEGSATISYTMTEVGDMVKHYAGFDSVGTYIRWIAEAAKFIAGGYDLGEGAIYHSPDGENWTIVDDGYISSILCAAYSTTMSRIVVIGSPKSDIGIIYSDDFINWHPVTVGSGRGLVSIDYNAELDIFSAYAQGTGFEGIAYSSDAVNWSFGDNGYQHYGVSIASHHGRAKFVMAAYDNNGAVMFTSENGINYIGVNPSLNMQPNLVKSFEKANRIVVIGNSNTRRNFAVSVDASKWAVSRNAGSTPLPDVFRYAIKYDPAKNLMELT